MKKSFLVFAFLSLIILVSRPQLFAGEIDILLDKLVEKGVVSPLDAQIIRDETSHQVAKEIAQGKSSSIPGWIQKFSLKGDLRTRYQWEEKDNQGVSEERHRGRIRFRLNASMKVTDGVKVGARLVTGGEDPRSTNQTLEDTFSTKGIQLDRAYVNFSPCSASTLLLGKFGNPFYSSHDLLWDSDLSFEGGAAQYERNIGQNMDLFLNAGFFILDEYKKGSDPMMYVIQPGMKWKITEDTDFKVGVSYYKFSNLKGRTLEHSSGTNSLMDISSDPNNPNEVLMYDYNSWGVDTELALNNIFMLPQIALVGEYVKNTDSDIGSDDKGFLAGIKIGAPKIKAPGQWQAFYSYRRLERDAFLDVFPDSDFYSGKTGVKGYEVIFQYGLKKNVILGLDYYETRPILGSDGSIQNLLQADLLFKF
jgi:hypothetical protein